MSRPDPLRTDAPAAPTAPAGRSVPSAAGPRPTGTRRAGRRGAVAAALWVAALAAGCGGADPAPAPPPVSEAEWVRAVMTERYLYADRMPKADLSGVAGAAGALDALRVNPPDRFSYVEQRARYDTFFDDGRALGLGIGYRIDGGAIVLRFVQPDSPAGRAGLRRGDRIAAIDGVPAATLVAEGRTVAALGPTEAGVVVRLARVRDGETREVVVTKDWYPVAPVLASRLIERDGARVGYVALYAFTEPARAAWADAIAALRTQGATRLVVDLRENGGGRLFVAAEIAGSLAPTAALGDTFVALRHAPRRAADDLAIAIPPSAAAGTFERVAWIVSEASCSASESLIAGLRPYRDDPLIGVTTCGKPVGFEPQVRGDVVLSAVTFETRNRDGFGGWFDGLAPTCAVPAEPYRAFGDEADPRLAEALHRLATGACSTAAAAAPVAPKSASRAGRWVPGLAGETGLF
jgi:C-terminal processing protease CtpA/Prc